MGAHSRFSSECSCGDSMTIIVQSVLDALIKDHHLAHKTQGKYGDFIDLYQKDLSSRNWVEVNLAGARLKHCLVEDGYFDSVDFSMCDFIGSDFKKSKFINVVFDYSRLLNTNFHKCIFVRCSFEGIKQGVMDCRALKKISKESDKRVYGKR